MFCLYSLLPDHKLLKYHYFVDLTIDLNKNFTNNLLNLELFWNLTLLTFIGEFCLVLFTQSISGYINSKTKIDYDWDLLTILLLLASKSGKTCYYIEKVYLLLAKWEEKNINLFLHNIFKGWNLSKQSINQSNQIINITKTLE